MLKSIFTLLFAQVLVAAPVPADGSSDENGTGVWAVNEEMDNHYLHPTPIVPSPRTQQDDINAAQATPPQQ